MSAPRLLRPQQRTLLRIAATQPLGGDGNPRQLDEAAQGPYLVKWFRCYSNPIAQLAIYALALTRRAPGLKPLFDIKCAWFNEEEYCEFCPRTLLAA